MADGYAQQQRELKASKIVAYLLGRAVEHAEMADADHVLGLVDDHDQICWRAGVKPASAETWALVGQILRARAAMQQPADPLDGVPKGPR